MSRATVDLVTIEPRRNPSDVITFAVKMADPVVLASRHRGRRACWIVLSVALIGALVIAAGHGAVSIPWPTVVGAIPHKLGLTAPWTVNETAIPLLWSIRFPRIVFGALVGATLATAGGALQGLFRNPLADPGVIGVSAGAALGTALSIVVGGRRLESSSAAVWVP